MLHRTILLWGLLFAAAESAAAEDPQLIPCAAPAGSRTESVYKLAGAVRRPTPVDTRAECKVGGCLSLMLELVINTDGTVRAVRVVKASAPRRDVEKACVPQACRFRFKPATLAGKPVAVQMSFNRIAKCN